MSTTPAPDGPTFTDQAYASIERAAGNRRDLYAPSVLQQAAALLTDLWDAGSRHGVTTDAWSWSTDLGGATLDVITRPYDRAPSPERTHQELSALKASLIGALADNGVTAELGPRTFVRVHRQDRTPPGGYDGTANLLVGIYSDGGWDVCFDAHGASVVSIAAPATEAGAVEVAQIVHALVNGELGNPLSR